MSKSEINAYIDSQLPDNTQQLIKPVNARNVTKLLNNEKFDLEDNTTDDIIEGAINKFATPEVIDDRVAQLIQPSADGKITWSYDDTNNTLTPVVDIPGVGGGGSRIPSGTALTNILTESNWSDPINGGDYSGPTISGLSEHDYYVDPYFRYEMLYYGSTSNLVPIRIRRTAY